MPPLRQDRVHFWLKGNNGNGTKRFSVTIILIKSKNKILYLDIHKICLYNVVDKDIELLD